eukprot:m.378430 g.378430  ORF g.378430 m.378430 type:complete len:71 (+) comp28216_c0_seq4:3153-3365(+)
MALWVVLPGSDHGCNETNTCFTPSALSADTIAAGSGQHTAGSNVKFQSAAGDGYRRAVQRAGNSHCKWQS